MTEVQTAYADGRALVPAFADPYPSPRLVSAPSGHTAKFSSSAHHLVPTRWLSGWEERIEAGTTAPCSPVFYHQGSFPLSRHFTSSTNCELADFVRVGAVIHVLNEHVTVKAVSSADVLPRSASVWAGRLSEAFAADCFFTPSLQTNQTAEFSKFLKRLVFRWRDTQKQASKQDPLEGFEKYQSANWDGYDADPITPETISSAREALKALETFVDRPDIAPGSDGGIGFEWVFEAGPVKKLFIDIGPGRTWSAYWRLLSGEKGKVARKGIDASLVSDLERVLSELGLVDGALRR